jgi:hypothetical protein
MGQFKDIALPLIARGIPVMPLLPKAKNAFLSGWQNLASFDLNQIEAWDAQYPEHNCGSVAKATSSGYWFLELDRPEAGQRIEAETGHSVPQTFRVRSSPGRGHLYWKQNAKSLAMGNISQNFVKDTDWSARVDNEYVVSPGSWHPKSGRQYEVVSNAEIVEAPDWLIDWCVSQKLDKKVVQKTIEEGGVIPHGARNVTLASLAGKMRHRMQADEDEIYAYLKEVNRKQCQPPLADEDIRVIAASIARYPVKNDIPLVRGVPIDVRASQAQQTASKEQTAEEIELPEIASVPYPKFPEWVMNGTSLYEGFVKPVCEVNSRYPEYMWMSAMVILMNFLALKVAVNKKRLIPSFFLINIGMKGRLHKSASVEDAIRYFSCMGVCDNGGVMTRNAEGKSLIYSPGSPEGLGIEMQRTQCKNAILYYDEFMTVVNKAGIDTSDLVSTLLKLYESGKFSNLIKARKDSFSLEFGTYCVSFIANTTDKNFIRLWSKLLGNESSGLKDRFFFLYQPQRLKDQKPFVDVNWGEGVVKTRKLIDAALAKKTYDIIYPEMLDNISKRMDDRQEQRVERLALAFAVDLGLDVIDDECIERAIAIVDYEQAVKKYLKTFETQTKEAQIQMEVIGYLMRHNGVALQRDVERALHPVEQHGTFLWTRSWQGLVMSGKIQVLGSGKKADPKQWQLLWVPEEEE